jgi:hypothetical protein
MSIYSKTINKNKEEILNCFKKSSKFYREEDETSTTIYRYNPGFNEIFIYIDNEDITLSEDGGMGSTGVIGKINIHPKNRSQCEMIITFQIGSFNVKTIKYLIMFLIIFLPILLILVDLIGLLLLVPIIFLGGIFLPLKINRMKFILNKVSKCLNVDKDWEKTSEDLFSFIHGVIINK